MEEKIIKMSFEELQQLLEIVMYCANKTNNITEAEAAHKLAEKLFHELYSDHH